MTRSAKLLFALLVLATFGAFFAAQSLKSQPGAVLQVRRDPLFSPNGDGRNERASVRFALRRSDRVTLSVVAEDGERVRELLTGRAAGPGRPVRATWDGRTDEGARAADGLYGFRVTLERQGRDIALPLSTRLDTTPPRPAILAVGPDRIPRAELLPKPDGTPARIRYRAPGSDAVLRLFRTAPGATSLVLEREVAPGEARFEWDGTVDGRPVEPGTYLAVAESRDAAGNLGQSVPLGEEGLPRLPFGEALPGRGGIEVRRLAAQPPLVPAAAGRPVDLLLDARGEPFRWSVRRAGSAAVIRRSRNPKTRPLVRLRTPAGTSGLFLFEVRSGGRAARAPFAVDDAADHPVLVVLPLMSLQGRNPLDDDGDGAPDTLDRGVGARLARVLVRETESFTRREAPLLATLDRRGMRYDLTTDLALHLGRGPRLEGHRGVLLPGDARWLPAPLQARLRRFVQEGGVVASAGIDSLRRTVELSRRGRMVRPTAPAPTDLFGARLGPVVARRTRLTDAIDDIGLFALPTTRGTAGVFRGIDAYEPVRAWRGLAAAAETPDGTPVIAAARLGEGLVIRFGLPDLPARADDPQVDALLERTWTLLSR